MRLQRRAFTIGLVFFAPLLLAACFKPVPRQIPQGLQTVTGVVKPVSLSLVRRGTHALSIGDTTLYYLESSIVNLGKYEGREVELQGLVEANTDPSDTPVLVVSKVTGGPSALTKTWSIDPLGVTVDTPSQWKGKVAGGNAQFSASGSSPIVTLFLDGETVLAKHAETGSAVTEARTVLGAHEVIRLLNTETGRERVLIDLRPSVTDPAQDVLTVLFTPATDAGIDPDTWSALKSDILQSLKFVADSSSSSSKTSSSLAPVTSSGAGMPCGGPAGILCPQGFRCLITDSATNVGRCASY